MVFAHPFALALGGLVLRMSIILLYDCHVLPRVPDGASTALAFRAASTACL